MSKTTVKLDELEKLALAALQALGLDQSECQTVCEVLMYAQLRDNSQGLIKITQRSILPDADKKPTESSIKSPCIAHINGNGNVGMVVLDEAARLAAQLSNSAGIAMVTTSNTRSSTGAIGYYVNHIATTGQIGIVLAGSPKVMAAEGGIDPVFGTNPVAIGIPTGGSPLVLDMATAAIAWFGIINARERGETLPAGCAFDSDGKPTIDPATALSGALRTFGGAKGSGLALMFEMLTGPLCGASIVGDSEDNRGNVVIAINPDIALDRDSFERSVQQLTSRIKSGRAVTNESIKLPGESSTQRANQCLENNRITLDKKLYEDILEITQH